jgi:hypothetical protein
LFLPIKATSWLIAEPESDADASPFARLFSNGRDLSINALDPRPPFLGDVKDDDDATI